jgi:hypothetical protein
MMSGLKPETGRGRHDRARHNVGQPKTATGQPSVSPTDPRQKPAITHCRIDALQTALNGPGSVLNMPLGDRTQSGLDPYKTSKKKAFLCHTTTRWRQVPRVQA